MDQGYSWDKDTDWELVSALLELAPQRYGRRRRGAAPTVEVQATMYVSS